MKLFDVKADGSLKISVENQMDRTIPEAQPWYTSKIYSFIALAVLSIIDLIGFWQIANLTLAESNINKVIIISAFAIAFEIAPLYIGYGLCLKCYGLGRNIHNWILGFATIACLLGVVANVLYRILTVDIVYINVQTGTVDKLGIPITIVMCILPVITSLVNLVIGCLSFDPLLFDLLRIEKKLRILKIKKRQVMASKHALSNNEVTKNELLEKEQKCYDISILQISAINLQLKNYITARCSILYDEDN